jgi:hypothetical protein
MSAYAAVVISPRTASTHSSRSRSYRSRVGPHNHVPVSVIRARISSFTASADRAGTPSGEVEDMPRS